MWICLNDAFLSIVGKDCGPDELMVRARRAGDIDRVFPQAKVIHTPTPADYRFRAVIKVKDVQAAMAREIANIDYGNFKDSVEDRALHDAYLRVWTAMMAVQPLGSRTGYFFTDEMASSPKRAPKRGAAKKRAKR